MLYRFLNTTLLRIVLRIARLKFLVVRSMQNSSFWFFLGGNMERYVLDIKGKDVLYFILLFKTLLMLCLISSLAYPAVYALYYRGARSLLGW